ncbi:MAG TPA: hypothetical protein VMZ28_00575 [Kofleriaceae bacterium]|nr:hypothetical protein [Kofleriaceae bacterium]
MNLTKAPWRRTLATVGLVGAIALLASRSCQGSLASTTIRFDVGPQAGKDLRLLRADLFRDDERDSLGIYQKHFEDDGAPAVIGPWTLKADEGDYRLEVELRGAAGTRSATRALHIEDGASVTVDLTNLTDASR